MAGRIAACTVLLTALVASGTSSDGNDNQAEKQSQNCLNKCMLANDGGYQVDVVTDKYDDFLAYCRWLMELRLCWKTCPSGALKTSILALSARVHVEYCLYNEHLKYERHFSSLSSCLSAAKTKLIRSAVGVVAEVGGNATAAEAENLCDLTGMLALHTSDVLTTTPGCSAMDAKRITAFIEVAYRYFQLKLGVLSTPSRCGTISNVLILRGAFEQFKKTGGGYSMKHRKQGSEAYTSKFDELNKCMRSPAAEPLFDESDPGDNSTVAVLCKYARTVAKCWRSLQGVPREEAVFSKLATEYAWISSEETEEESISSFVKQVTTCGEYPVFQYLAVPHVKYYSGGNASISVAANLCRMFVDASRNIVHDEEFKMCTQVAKRAIRHEATAAYWMLGLKLGLAGEMYDPRCLCLTQRFV